MLAKLREMGSVLHMSLFLLLGGFLTGGANGADRVELNGLQNQFTPTVSDKPPDELGKMIGFAAGLEDGSELSFQQKTSSASNIDHLHYEQVFRGVPVWGERVTISRNKANEIVRYSGAVLRGLSFDVPDTRTSISPQAALARAKSEVRQGGHIAGGDLKSENENVRLVVYVRPADKKAFLSYEVSFFAPPDGAGKATRPFFLIDAKTGNVLYRYEGLANESGTGPGGNQRTGKYFYGRGGLPSLEVQSLGKKCRLDIVTINFNNKISAPDIAFEFKCRVNTFKESNGGYAPLNDAHYFAGVAVKMYREWYGTDPIQGKVLLRVHYSEKYQNAFWNGKCLTFGDGGDAFYPLVALDIMAHELSHGFTEQHSNLIYTGESGAINEAFSDMAGEAAKSFAANGDQSDFRIGSTIMKGNEDKSLRYLCDPTRDGRSIDNARDYKGELDVHHASGVYNKAFCLLAKTGGWDVRKAFGAFLAANRDYWAPSTTFISGARDVVHAAQDAGYRGEDVKAAFNAVGIALDDTPASSSQATASSSQAPAAQALLNTQQASVQTNAPEPSASAAVKKMQEDQGIIGEWIIPESGEVLSIIGSGQWFHPKHGRARLREAKDDADFKVYYTSSNAQCSYRVSFSDVGKTLNLTATDPTQDPDFCPSGRLRSLDRKR